MPGDLRLHPRNDTTIRETRSLLRRFAHRVAAKIKAGSVWIAPRSAERGAAVHDLAEEIHSLEEPYVRRF